MTNDVSSVEKEPDQFLSALTKDSRVIAQYTLENGIALTSTRQVFLMLAKIEQGRHEDDDILELIKHYNILCLEAGNVTPESIQATRRANGNYFHTRAGRHLIKLWVVTFITIGFIAFYVYISKYCDLVQCGIEQLGPRTEEQDSVYYTKLILSYFLPFMYGTLGACAYLLRVTGRHLLKHDFDVDRVPEHWNRLILGTLSGGMIVLFVRDTGGIALAEGALGFLAGYSIEFLFAVLDRIINAILPKVGSSQTEESNPNRKITQRLKTVIGNDHSTPEQKKLAKQILEELA